MLATYPTVTTTRRTRAQGSTPHQRLVDTLYAQAMTHMSRTPLSIEAMHAALPEVSNASVRARIR